MFDNLVMVAIGILVTLMGFGKVPVSKDSAKNAEYLQKYGKILRIGGIIVIALSLFLAFSKLFD